MGKETIEVAKLQERINKLEEALMKACRLLHKAGVVYGKENGKPIRLNRENWYIKLMEEN